MLNPKVPKILSLLGKEVWSVILTSFVSISIVGNNIDEFPVDVFQPSHNAFNKFNNVTLPVSTLFNASNWVKIHSILK